MLKCTWMLCVRSSVVLLRVCIHSGRNSFSQASAASGSGCDGSQQFIQPAGSGELIHPILGEVTQIVVRMNSPGLVSVSADDKGNPKGWLTRCLTSGRLKLVETRLSLYKIYQGMAARFFFFFLCSHVENMETKCAALFWWQYFLKQETPEWLFVQNSEVEERRGEKEKIFLIEVNHDRQQGT